MTSIEVNFPVNKVLEAMTQAESIVQRCSESKDEDATPFLSLFHNCDTLVLM